MRTARAALALALVLLHEPAAVVGQHDEHVPPPVLVAGADVAYVCPMHADYTSASPGRCPRDGMPLALANPYIVDDYRLDFDTTPIVARAGETTTLRFAVFHPSTGEPVRDFLSVHDRRYHLFVISQDMSHFEHLHPDQGPDGRWSIDVTLPRAGYYKILSDFVPSGGSSQFIARPLVTAGYAGDIAGDSARLEPDSRLTKTTGDLTASLSYDPSTFVAGLYGHFNFRLSDARTGRAVADLQPYLGSFGHMLIMSEDMVHYVHSHPLDLGSIDDEETGPRPLMVPMGVDSDTLRGGPDITFEGLMPKPGRYRAWTQFRRNDIVHTFAFTFEVH